VPFTTGHREGVGEVAHVVPRVCAHVVGPVVRREVLGCLARVSVRRPAVDATAAHARRRHLWLRPLVWAQHRAQLRQLQRRLPLLMGRGRCCHRVSDATEGLQELYRRRCAEIRTLGTPGHAAAERRGREGRVRFGEELYCT
jgi:hypothetical protein